MSLPYCKCGHDVEYHPNGGGCSKLCATGEVCNCEEFNDSRIAELETQLAALTRPPMVRDLPKVEGWYWYKPLEDGFNGLGLVRVFKSDENEQFRAARDCWMASVSLEGVVSGYWSAIPVTPDEQPVVIRLSDRDAAAMIDAIEKAEKETL